MGVSATHVGSTMYIENSKVHKHKYMYVYIYK